MFLKFSAADGVFYDDAQVDFNIDIYRCHLVFVRGSRRSSSSLLGSVETRLGGIQHCLASRTNHANCTFLEKQADVGELLQFF